MKMVNYKGGTNPKGSIEFQDQATKMGANAIKIRKKLPDLATKMEERALKSQYDVTNLTYFSDVNIVHRSVLIETNKAQQGASAGRCITNKNPFDDMQLRINLKRLEKEQRLVSSDIFRKQRHFFIARAFNENGDLKYPKLKQEIIGKRTSSREGFQGRCISRSSSTASITSPVSSYSSKQSRRESVSSAVFPKIDTENVNENYKFRRRSSLPIHIKKPLSKPRRSLPGILDLNIIKCNSDVVPIEIDNKTKIIQHVQGNRFRRKSSPICDKGDEENSKMVKTFESIAENGNEKEMNVQNISIATGGNPIKTEVKDTMQKRPKDKTINKNNLSSPDLKIDLSEILESNDSSKLLGESTMKSTTDDLLLKLSRSLPMNLLHKTEIQALSDLSSSGFAERRKAFLEREKSAVTQSVLDDGRFQNLMKTLYRHAKHL